ncbi:hypothetical protein EPI10_020825 [Gossypium australe]|uniref:Uncharacterized protein n=1 Tax=Gossypium australe TaxID=47621 RepID=A0A5B6WGC1_9ROSI|nr:hypothetical protein EPI10_020825 [Gossypium australe]
MFQVWIQRTYVKRLSKTNISQNLRIAPVREGAHDEGRGRSSEKRQVGQRTIVYTVAKQAEIGGLARVYVVKEPQEPGLTDFITSRWAYGPKVEGALNGHEGGVTRGEEFGPIVAA